MQIRVDLKGGKGRGDGLLSGRMPRTLFGLTLAVAVLVHVPAPALAGQAIATAITVGWYHTCAVTQAGGVKCWGDNTYGELGDGTQTERDTPVNVKRLAGGVTAIAAGFAHTCAVTQAGGLKCWGYNVDGELGDGTTTERDTPVFATRLRSGVTAIGAGYQHTCAVTDASGLKCWGYNVDEELGDGTTTDRLTPVNVHGLTSGVAAVDGGAYHTCAVTQAGGLKCWGYNGYGELGNGTNTNPLHPVDVSGLTSGVAAVAAGERHTCALTEAGGVKCWGYNYDGELGNGDRTPDGTNTPVDVTRLRSGVAAVAAGPYYTCALTEAGGVKCWGLNDHGQLGDGTTTNRLTPVNVSGLASGVAAIAAGAFHTCALTVAGAVKCWGDNSYGQLGDGTTTGPQLTPVKVKGF